MRRVGRRIRFLKKPIVQNELIRPLRRTLPGLTGLIASPGAREEPQGAERSVLDTRSCAPTGIARTAMTSRMLLRWNMRGIIAVRRGGCGKTFAFRFLAFAERH